MTWRRIIEVIILVFLIAVTAVVNPISALILFLFKIGFDFSEIFVCVFVWTSFTLVLTYYEINQIKKWPTANMVLEKFKSWYLQNGFGRENKKHQKILVSWLAKLRNWAVIILGFVPFPYLPTVIIIATRLLNIRYGILFLLLGNAVRLWIYSNQIYQVLLRLFP